jgi:NADPH:quinone reductase-like Zn-dependent oxidoreductase
VARGHRPPVPCDDAIPVREPEARHIIINKENHEDMLALKELTESGKLTPVIDRTYPLAEAPGAIRYLEEGHAKGKVVVTV